MMSGGADGMGCCSHQHKHTGRGPPSEFLFYILSAGCVMMPFIKVGNYLTEVPLYWIWVQICRRPEASGCEVAERTFRGWYQHQRGRLPLCSLTLLNGIPSTCYPILPRDPRRLRPRGPRKSTLRVITAASPAEILNGAVLYRGNDTTAASLRQKDTKASSFPNLKSIPPAFTAQFSGLAIISIKMLHP